ncbi:WYL domain-containing protein [Chromobacterium haemolyticum]|uniref:WYL domain-containing protein n=1 Tax=Chromobacterium haemolyticum TaxID=394935 RepID=A0ABS3GR63_9NEIS|nr:WYL domain-containing protein [Chromobacterium haemolyticum]MBO0417223.1 WYL domain-containing protein [Chromobacterium haemolyticum]MBO0500303.1 WYL domain-containing protein [Chromobacterium haemolyticum]
MKTTPTHPTEARAPSRWGPEKRLEFIDFRLRWDGRLNRGDISDFFGVSTPQASLDIARYLEMAPDNAEYDRSERSYIATEAFHPLFPSSQPQKYLSDLLGQAYGIFGQGVSFLGWAPPVAVAPTPARTLSAETLITLLGAMRRSCALEMTYQSMTSPTPKKRLVSPRAFGHDGHRWHVRVYCHMENGYRDFVIARILSLGMEQASPVPPPTDHDWETLVTLVLAPNPGLPKAHQRVIELDYGMENGELRFECRRALLLYVVRNLGLDEAEGKSPKVQQIILHNRTEIEPLLPPVELTHT